MIKEDKLERRCKEVVVAYFRVLFRLWPRGTVANYEKPQLL
jgi:hypothetical protein